MPEPETIRRARADKREGKAPSTQAGEFVREEIHHIREGKHGATSTKQAIAIGLSKARRATKVSAKRSRAALGALKKEGGAAASKTALARHAKASARKRTAADRSASAKKAARTRARNA